MHRSPFPLSQALFISLALFGLVIPSAGLLAANTTLPKKVVIPKQTADLLEKYCTSCHEEGTEKGKVRLDNLDQLPMNAQLDLMDRALEQVYLEQMPPKKKEQPSISERKALNDWLTAELRAHDAAKFEEKLRFPNYGNAVDHDKLFSGKVTDAPFSPARRWLVSPQIFIGRVQDIFDPTDDKGPLSIKGISNPFLLPDTPGVRYYDNAILDGGILLTMLGNADWISKKQVLPARIKNGELTAKDLPVIDRWVPRKTPEAFEKIILKKSPATDEEITAAVRTQYDRVLHREPTTEELKKTFGFARMAIDMAGNTEGLRQMLKSVILDSEFLYRTEFGDGMPDQFGRKLLSPREGAYAISYALGDRGPDAELLEAAAQGHLSSKEDYKREVLRLLEDQTYYKGPTDPLVILARNAAPPQTPHPKILRFFREFFGYPNSVKVFKDTERSGFYYRNPEIYYMGTPGLLTYEADLLVEAALKKDQHVFETLIGGEEFFVAPIPDAAKKMNDLDKLYERFKDSDWRKDADKLVAENGPFLKEMMIPLQAGHLKAAMTHATRFREKNLRPNPEWNYAFDLLMHWIRSYNLEPFEWNYAAVQPFKLPHRKGLLTHPAWLIAFSHNTANDPVARGRWIREKLLAGRIPDVPITVDAKVPEDPHATLRTRLELVTKAEYCWKCHVTMNPLGMPFESFDDFGRYRTEEPNEAPENLIKKVQVSKRNTLSVYKTLPVETTGELTGTGDPTLDGPVANTDELIQRLVKSARVRQSIIRYAFRFYMGRNEMLSDSKTLMDADNAYVKSGGSFKAVIVSLLTSDSFMYRK